MPVRSLIHVPSAARHGGAWSARRDEAATLPPHRVGAAVAQGRAGFGMVQRGLLGRSAGGFLVAAWGVCPHRTKRGAGDDTGGPAVTLVSGSGSECDLSRRDGYCADGGLRAHRCRMAISRERRGRRSGWRRRLAYPRRAGAASEAARHARGSRGIHRSGRSSLQRISDGGPLRAGSSPISRKVCRPAPMSTC